MSSTTSIWSRTFAALQVRNFRLYFIGQLISVSGTWMQSVAQNWLVLQLTGSASDLGISVALQFLPMLFFGFYGGLVADRNPKRKILLFTQLGAGLLALSLGLLVTTHHVTLTWLFVMSFALGCVNLFDQPARQSFVQQMVGKDLITNAVSLNSVLMNAGRLVGPGIAAVFIAVLGDAMCFYANAVSYLAVVVALLLMNTAEFLPLATVSREKGQVRLGLRYVRDTPILRNVIFSVTVVGTLALNFGVTLPLLARTTFHQHSAAAYGVMMAALGFGAIIGGLYTAFKAMPTPKMLLILASGFAVSLSALTFAPTLLIAQLLMVPTGGFMISFMSSSNATLQMNSSGQMRGRVMSLYGTAFLGTTPIGAPLVGVVIGLTNPRIGILVGALSAVFTAGWLAVQYRRDVQSELDSGTAPAS